MQEVVVVFLGNIYVSIGFYVEYVYYFELNTVVKWSQLPGSL